MRSRALSISAAILSICLTGIPTHAAPVAITQVVQVLGSYNQSPQIELRNFSQKNLSVQGPGDQKNGSKGGKTTDSLISGVTVKSDGPVTVDVIDQGDVEGTICDCGELLLAGGGFPKWPFLFLGAIPLFFIHSDDTPNTPTPTPTPPPPSVTPTPPTAVPEPASLILLATGLAGAGSVLRRKRFNGHKKKEED
jgi:hypothetical protein